MEAVRRFLACRTLVRMALVLVLGMASPSSADVPSDVAGTSDPPRVGSAVTPPFPCSVGTRSFTTTAPQMVLTMPTVIVSKSVTVTGMGPFLWDLDLETWIRHPKVGELTITLESPGGVTITIARERGGVTADAYHGTVWDDQAGEPVSDHTFGTGLAAHLSPEQAVARLRGTNPNGVWTIYVSDPVANDTYGVFESATLRVTALPLAPAWTVTTVTDTPPTPIAIPNGPAGAAVTRTLSVANPGGAPIGDVVLTTDIPHEWSGDLDITLTSPRGTVALITNGNPRGASAMFDNVYAGTIWSVLGPPVTLEAMVDGTAELMLGAEEPLSVFAGEDPQGLWTLSITDRYNHPGFFNDATVFVMPPQVGAWPCPPGKYAVLFQHL